MILRKDINNNNTIDYDTDNYYGESNMKVSYIDDEENNDDFYGEKKDDVKINENDFLNSLDGGEPKPKRQKQKSTTKTYRSTTMKKKKKLDVVYDIGEDVVYRRKNAKVMYGPYEKNYKMFYELQMEDGTVTCAVAQSVRKEKV